MAKQGKYLNDDVFYEVLSLLPASVLVRLKRVSKAWRALITDAGFTRAQLRRTKPSLSGFVFQQRYQWSNEDIKTSSYIPVAGPPRVHDTLFDFLPDDVVVLSSSNGLVCCRSCFPTLHPVIYVCNPANKQWLTLDSPWLGRDCNVALAFDTDFKLVIVEHSVIEVERDEDEDEDEDEVEDEEEQTLLFEFRVYSSKTRDWTKSRSTCKSDSKLGLSKGKSVYVNGTLHWLTQANKILTFRLEDELPLLVPIPAPALELSNAASHACIGISGGSLHYTMISEQGLSLWSLKDYASSEWVLEHWISLYTMEQEYMFRNLSERVSTGSVGVEDIPWVNPLAFEGDVLMVRVGTKIYLYGFDSGKMRGLCDASELGSDSMFFPTVVPYSMSLFPLIH